MRQISNQQKCHFSYYLLCIFFYRIGEQEGGTGSALRQGKDRVAWM
jgi:hypothetical protein